MLLIPRSIQQVVRAVHQSYVLYSDAVFAVSDLAQAVQRIDLAAASCDNVRLFADRRRYCAVYQDVFAACAVHAAVVLYPPEYV